MIFTSQSSHWGSGEAINIPKDTQLARSGAEVWIQDSETWKATPGML